MTARESPEATTTSGRSTDFLLKLESRVDGVRALRALPFVLAAVAMIPLLAMLAGSGTLL